jgi:crotonobetainyl-CoA:carnitine CoA-transferase CaiB-like acyl-CoA transferase
MTVSGAPEPSARSGPLAKYRVLELGSTVAGPFCGRLFADFGAEVIKVEPLEGDAIRSIGSRYEGKSLYAASIFRNKSLIAVDLRTKEGQDVVRKLAAQSDVVIENFRPGALEKWGLGYDALSSINPRIVMVRISGYGQSGPYSKRPGYGIICEAVGGLRHLVGDPDRPPARVAISLTDYVTGLYAFSGAMMALLHRETSGVGQCVDAALYESAFSLMEQHIAAYEKLGVVAKRLGPGTGSAPNNLYPTADGQLIHIAANSGGTFKRLLHAMERSELLEDERFSTAIARAANREALDGLVRDWTQRHAVADLERVLDEVDVPASRIYTLPDIFKDPHYKAREAIVNAPDEDLGTVAVAGVVPRLSATPGRIRHAGRHIGADTAEVLARVAGLTATDIERLTASRVVARGTRERPASGTQQTTPGAD